MSRQKQRTDKEPTKKVIHRQRGVYHLAFIYLAMAFTSSCVPSTDEGPDRPNIIFILADDLGIGDVSCYNPDGRILTPAIDALAQNGAVYTDAHTTSSVCTPSRYSILTGRYNWRSWLKAGVTTGTSPHLIDTTLMTAASLLRQADYRTSFVGKWHLGWDWDLKDSTAGLGSGWRKDDFSNIDFTKPIKYGPRSVGFDYSYALPASLDIAPYVYVENEQVTAQPDRITIDTSEYGWWRQGPTGADLIHEEVTPHFFKKAEELVSEAANSDDPFFLYLALPSPHTPILPSPEWQGKSKFLPYADFVMMVDHYIGRLVDLLATSGQLENTLLILSSDNGCSPAAGFQKMVENNHLPSLQYRGHKADIYEGGHRVPFIAHWPKVITAHTSDQMISQVDFLATCADIAGVTLDTADGVDSYSLLPLWKDMKAQYNRTASVQHSVDGTFAYRKGTYKFISHGSSGGWSFPRPSDQEALDTLPPYQLYNLANDPAESLNLYTSQRDLAQQMKAELENIIVNGRSTPGPSQQNDDAHDGNWPQLHFMQD